MGKLAFEQPCHRNLGEFRGPGASRDHAKTSWSGCHRLWLMQWEKIDEPILSAVDSWGGIGDFQHFIVLIRGQEERIPTMANVVGTSIGLRLFSLWFCVSDFISAVFNGFRQNCCDFEIWIVFLDLGTGWTGDPCTQGYRDHWLPTVQYPRIPSFLGPCPAGLLKALVHVFLASEVDTEVNTSVDTFVDTSVDTSRYLCGYRCGFSVWTKSTEKSENPRSKPL